MVGSFVLSLWVILSADGVVVWDEDEDEDEDAARSLEGMRASHSDTESSCRRIFLRVFPIVPLTRE